MQTKYVVIDHEGNPSWNTKTDSPESFLGFRNAEKRAKELAGCNPGETIGIYELTGEVRAPVGKVESERRHPIEHYK